MNVAARRSWTGRVGGAGGTRGAKASGHEVGTEEEVRTWGHLPDPDCGLPSAVQPGRNCRDAGTSRSRDCLFRVFVSPYAPYHVTFSRARPGRLAVEHQGCAAEAWLLSAHSHLMNE